MTTNGGDGEDVDISKKEFEVQGEGVDESNIISSYGIAVLNTPKTLIQSLNDDLNILQVSNQSQIKSSF